MKPRFPPKKIVVAMDASQPSWAALEAAKKIALKMGSELEAVFVEELVPAPEFEPALTLMKRDRRGDVERGLAGAMAGFPARQWSLRVATGHPVAELLRRAVSRYAQLLVMGTHGRQGGERFLMGSTAEAVFHRARIPVLAVRAGVRFDPDRLLVPCNLKSYGDEALEYALAFAAVFGSKVAALYVPGSREWDIDADDDLWGHLETAVGAEAALEVDRVVRQGEAREQIAREAKSGRYGLVVLSGHHREQLSDLALGTTAERLLRQLSVPMLVVPASRPAAVLRRQGLGMGAA